MGLATKEKLLFAALAVGVALALTRGLAAQPGFTDAFYHFNAAERLATGQGLTDAYLWTYIGAPERLPAPSHLYWMPLTSLTAALGMWLLDAPGNYQAAQLPFALMLAGTAYVGFWLGGKIGGTRRHAWLAGLLVLFSGFYTRFWGATDTFAPYALVGALCLAALGRLAEGTPEAQEAGAAHEPSLRERRPLGTVIPSPAGKVSWAAAAGALAGLAHLTRADGVLLLGVGWVAVLWGMGTESRGHRKDADKGDGEQMKMGAHHAAPLQKRVVFVVVMTAVYGVVMLPWFARNLNVVGSALPVGGAQGVWFTEYNDLFSYPPDASAETFFANGIGRLLATRWEALANNLARFVAEQGLVVMTPLMLVGLWMRRRDPFLRPFWLYALGLHVAMTLVFPFPGYRGGLFHSAAALVPFWTALGVAGLDDVVGWIAKRRRHWRAGTAQRVFSAALLGFAVYLSLSTGLAGRASAGTPRLYAELNAALPPDARVMLNDPAALYYFTERGGVVLPNEEPAVIAEIARKYGVGYLLLESPAGTPAPLWSLYETTPDFLTPLPFDVPNARLYAIAD